MALDSRLKARAFNAVQKPLEEVEGFESLGQELKENSSFSLPDSFKHSMPLPLAKKVEALRTSMRYATLYNLPYLERMLEEVALELMEHSTFASMRARFLQRWSREIAGALPSYDRKFFSLFYEFMNAMADLIHKTKEEGSRLSKQRLLLEPYCALNCILLEGSAETYSNVYARLEEFLLFYTDDELRLTPEWSVADELLLELNVKLLIATSASDLSHLQISKKEDHHA